MHTLTYIYTYMYISMQMCIHTSTPTYMLAEHTCILTNMHITRYMNTHTYTYTCTCVYIYIYIHVQRHVHIHRINRHIHIHINVSIHVDTNHACRMARRFSRLLALAVSYFNP